MRSYFVSATALAMTLSAVLSARSDEIPNLDVRPVCRGIASQSASNPADIGIKTTYEQCIESEQQVREQLKKDWSTFSAADKQHCVALAQSGGESSNTELLTCLEMARNVRALRSTEAPTSGATTSQIPSSPPTTAPSASLNTASRSPPANEPSKSKVDATLKELQRVKADAQNARTSEALLQRKLADTEADLKRVKQEAARAANEAEQAKVDAKAAQEAKAEAERKLGQAEAARTAAEERLKASESAAKNQRGFGAWLRGWFGHKPSNQ